MSRVEWRTEQKSLKKRRKWMSGNDEEESKRVSLYAKFYCWSKRFGGLLDDCSVEGCKCLKSIWILNRWFFFIKKGLFENFWIFVQ